MRNSHTTKQAKAKCLKYRDGKRCGRVGKYLCSWKDAQGYHSYPVCRECSEAIVAQGGEVIENSPKGYTVTVGLFDSSRTYKRII